MLYYISPKCIVFIALTYNDKVLLQNSQWYSDSSFSVFCIFRGPSLVITIQKLYRLYTNNDLVDTFSKTHRMRVEWTQWVR